MWHSHVPHKSLPLSVPLRSVYLLLERSWQGYHRAVIRITEDYRADIMPRRNVDLPPPEPSRRVFRYFRPAETREIMERALTLHRDN